MHVSQRITTGIEGSPFGARRRCDLGWQRFRIQRLFWWASDTYTRLRYSSTSSVYKQLIDLGKLIDIVDDKLDWWPWFEATWEGREARRWGGIFDFAKPDRSSLTRSDWALLCWGNAPVSLKQKVTSLRWQSHHGSLCVFCCFICHRVRQCVLGINAAAAKVQAAIWLLNFKRRDRCLYQLSAVITV